MSGQDFLKGMPFHIVVQAHNREKLIGQALPAHSASPQHAPYRWTDEQNNEPARRGREAFKERGIKIAQKAAEEGCRGAHKLV